MKMLDRLFQCKKVPKLDDDLSTDADYSHRYSHLRVKSMMQLSNCTIVGGSDRWQRQAGGGLRLGVSKNENAKSIKKATRQKKVSRAAAVTVSSKQTHTNH